MNPHISTLMPIVELRTTKLARRHIVSYETHMHGPENRIKFVIHRFL